VSRTPPQGDPGLLVVTNAAAGSGDTARTDAALQVLRSGARPVEVAATADLDELDRVLARREGRHVVVAGGDGSLHAVVKVLWDRGDLDAATPLGLIPLGTGNDLARTVGVPLDPAAAARVALDGRPRALELLVDDAGDVVVNAVHVGIGAEAGRAALEWKPRLGAGAYALGSVLAGVTTRGWRLAVTVDGEQVHDGSDPLLMLALGLGRSIGGGALLTPDAVPDDGVVEVVLSAATGPLARVGYGAALRSGRHVERDDVTVVRGRVVTVAALSEEDAFPYNADGEVEGPVRSRTWTLHLGAWSLTVP